MKKYILLLILILLLTASIGAAAQDAAPETITFGDWDAIRNNKGWTLSAYHGNEAAPEIPSSIEDESVTQLGKGLFKNNFSLETAVIPDSVTAIGAEAFFGCSSLTNVVLPRTLARIEANTFQYCIRLEEIDIPISVTFIGNYAFADCIELREIVLLSVTSIGESAFDDCPMLSSVSVSRKLVTLGTHAFRDTAWLDMQTDEFTTIGKGILIQWNGTGAEAEVPLGITAIVDTFEKAYSLESVILPDTVTQIGSNAFKDAVNLTSIRLPAHLTTIGANAFENCRSLEKIELPDDVKSIGGSAFRGCERLKSFAFPPQVTSIGALILADCKELTDVILSKNVEKMDARVIQSSEKAVLNVPYNSFAEQFAIENQLPYAYALQKSAGFVYSPQNDGVRILQYTGNVHHVEIPAVIDGLPVVAVNTAAFQDNRSVRSVTVPLTVKTIGDWAFSYMDSLESVLLPAGLNSLGSNVFTGSPALKEIRIPKGVTQIGSDLLDTEAATMICAAEGSEAAGILQDMGYEIQAYELCAGDPETEALWEKLTALGLLTALDDCSCVDTVKESADSTIFRIPEGVTELTGDLLGGNRGSLFLVIPSSVTEIAEDILEDRELTIISQTGSAAEAFAKEHDIKFLVMFDAPLNYQ